MDQRNLEPAAEASFPGSSFLPPWGRGGCVFFSGGFAWLGGSWPSPHPRDFCNVLARFTRKGISTTSRSLPELPSCRLGLPLAGGQLLATPPPSNAAAGLVLVSLFLAPPRTSIQRASKCCCLQPGSRQQKGKSKPCPAHLQPPRASTAPARAPCHPAKTILQRQAKKCHLVWGGPAQASWCTRRL